MNRRQFLAASGLASFARAQPSPAQPRTAQPSLRSDAARFQSTYDAALAGLHANVRPVFEFPRPVLIEGATYIGAWLECAPLESLCYAPIAPEVALATHEIFFDLQRDDGYIPCNVKADRKGTGQIQMVVPIAATAWDLYRQNRNSAFLDRAYRACARWDEWLLRYRNTRGTGLCEAFCTYDTGHDNSPRFAGKPAQCPGADARVCPKIDGLPYLALDSEMLRSATSNAAPFSDGNDTFSASLSKVRHAVTWGGTISKHNALLARTRNIRVERMHFSY